MTHTPGPWVAPGEEDGAEPICEVKHFLLAKKVTNGNGTHYEIDADIYVSGDEKEAETTFRLIAAAPALLEALEELCVTSPSALTGKARAAIALAKGETNE